MQKAIALGVDVNYGPREVTFLTTPSSFCPEVISASGIKLSEDTFLHS